MQTCDHVENNNYYYYYAVCLDEIPRLLFIQQWLLANSYSNSNATFLTAFSSKQKKKHVNSNTLNSVHCVATLPSGSMHVQLSFGSLLQSHISHSNWYKMVCMGDLDASLMRLWSSLATTNKLQFIVLGVYKIVFFLWMWFVGNKAIYIYICFSLHI